MGAIGVKLDGHDVVLKVRITALSACLHSLQCSQYSHPFSKSLKEHNPDHGNQDNHDGDHDGDIED